MEGIRNEGQRANGVSYLYKKYISRQQFLILRKQSKLTEHVKKGRGHGPTISSTKKKTTSRTRRKMILAERDMAMVCEVGKGIVAKALMSNQRVL